MGERIRKSALAMQFAAVMNFLITDKGYFGARNQRAAGSKHGNKH
jgi:hypothetical protein